MESETESKQEVKKGGHHSRFLPIILSEIKASPFVKIFFENACRINFCEMITEVGSHVPLTSLFAHNFHIDKVFIERVEFTVSTYIIYLATGIPNQGEKWFKGMEL